jgi:hypothetical protein
VPVRRSEPRSGNHRVGNQGRFRNIVGGVAAPLLAKRRRRKGRAGRRSRLPKKVLRVTTYERLSEYLTAFAAGHFHLLILVGAGGLAKSRSVRAVLGGTGCWIEGNATPFGMYVKLFHHKDEFVVIDDVDALYADRSGVGVSLSSDQKRTLSPSGTPSSGGAGLPRPYDNDES